MNHQTDLRSLRSKGGENQDEEDDRFDFDRQEYSIDPHKKFEVLRSRIRGSLKTENGPTEKVSNPTIDNPDVLCTKEMINRMTLKIKKNNIADHNPKVEEGIKLIDNDPLVDNVYTSFHRRMLLQENRMHQVDVNQSVNEAERLILVNDKLDMPSWVGTLQKITVIDNPHDAKELAKKKKMTKQYIKKLLDRYNKMEKHNHVLNKEIKKIKLVPIRRTPKIYQNLDRKDDVEYHSSSDDEEDEDNISNEELSRRRLRRREVQAGGSIVIGLSYTDMVYSRFAIIAEPLKTPAVILASSSEKRHWKSLTDIPKQLEYSARINNQFAKFKQKTLIPLTLNADEIKKDEDCAPKILSSMNDVLPHIPQKCVTTLDGIVEHVVTASAVSSHKHPLKSPDEETNGENIKDMMSVSDNSILLNAVAKDILTNGLHSAANFMINEDANSKIHNALDEKGEGDDLIKSMTECVKSKEETHPINTVEENSIKMYSEERNDSTDDQFSIIAKEIIRNVDRDGEAMIGDDTKQRDEVSEGYSSQDKIIPDNSIKMKEYLRQNHAERALLGTTSSKKISKMEFTTSKYSDMQNDVLNSIISSVHNSNEIDIDESHDHHNKNNEEDSDVTDSDTNQTAIPFKSLMSPKNANIITTSKSEINETGSKHLPVHKLHTGHMSTNAMEVEQPNTEQPLINKDDNEAFKKDYNKLPSPPLRLNPNKKTARRIVPTLLRHHKGSAELFPNQTEMKYNTKIVRQIPPTFQNDSGDHSHASTKSTVLNSQQKTVTKVVSALQSSTGSNTQASSKSSLNNPKKKAIKKVAPTLQSKPKKGINSPKRVEVTQINILQVRKKPKPNPVE